jgi:hypothetical protein
MSILIRAAAAALLAATPACGTIPPAGTGSQPPTTGGQTDTARAALAALPAAGAPHPAGYSRARFGSAWADVDHNGCDTRDDILARDLADITRAKNNCTVLAGALNDPYTGHTVQFHRGVHSSDVQIDHIYPLHRAWLYGASDWKPLRREAFANDRSNLLAVYGPANEAKGDKGPGQWQPPNGGYRCAYAVGYIHVAASYRLPVTSGDRRVLTGMLDVCPKRGR